MVTKKSNSRMFSVLFIVAMLVGVVAFPYSARAASLTVTKIADTNDGVCDSDCSLREAIAVASTGDTISFDLSLWGGTIYLASSLLIDKSLTIDGFSLPSHIQISGDTDNNGTGDVSVFQISGPSIVELNGLDIIKGKAGFANGGGISNLGTLNLMNSTISNNSSFLGGGIFNSGNLTISNSNVSGNSAFTGGGGVLNDNGGTITVVNSTISNNSAPNGGGIFNLSTTGTVNISNSTLSGNSVSDNGGGLSNWGTLTATNITLLGNSAAKYGGGIFNLGTSTITNSTISESSALISGGGIYNANTLNYTNTIVANSTSGGDCFNDNLGMINTNTHNLVENNSASPNQCGVPSLISDPKLGVLSDNGGFTQTMALGAGSPAIDAGNDANCPATDQRGMTRPQGSHCDIGAYEYRHLIYFVKSNAGGANNGTSWTNAYTDLQSALSASLFGDEIWVAAGTYKPTTDTDRTVSFVLKNGVAVYGGFAGTETLRTQRNSAANVTTLSGEIGAAGIADNSYHVVEGSDIDNTSVLDGFSITAGNGKDVPFQDPWGGGMRVFLGSPTLSNLIFTSNTAYAGGGIVLDNSNSILTNVTFNGNSTSFGGGGGMLVVAGTPTLRNVTFNGNLAESGGGMATSNASPFLENVTFNGNIVSGYGGGMYNGLSDSILKNVTFSGNTAAISGGAMYNDESNPIITNSILWGNTGGEITNILGGSPVVTYSIVQGGYTGTGNLNADPLLGLLANNGGYTQTMALGAGSLAINTGTDTGCPATDQRGVARPQGSHCDIGAYESPASGDFAWAKGIGGTSNDDGNSIFVDSNNNVYTTGSFQGTVDFDPGAGVSNLTSAGADDIFVSKSDSDGTLLWAKRMGGASGDYGLGITVDSSGNIYTTGYFFGTADFDPGVGTVNLINAGGTDVFISKLDGSGNFVWAKSMGETSYEYGSTIAIDLNGNIYTIGAFSGTVDFDPGAGVSNRISAGADDVFVSKLDNNGNFVWAKSMGGAGAESGYSITLDSNSNFYITGQFQLTADFDPGAGISNLTSSGEDDIFISKLDANGNLLWAKSVGGTGVDYGNDIELDSSGNIYTMGHFQNTVDFNPSLIDTLNLTSAGGFDIFVSKLDSGGNFLWAKNMGGTSNDFGFNMVLDTYGDVYTTGSFQGTADFDPSVGVSNLTSVGAEDIFLSKLNATGNFVWNKGMGGTLGDQGFGIALDLIGNIYTIGSFQGTADFDPGVDVFNLISSGGKDIFISKLYNDINPIVSSIIRTNPSPTIAAIVNFTVNFSESVTGVDAGDFTLITTGGVSGAAVSGVSGSGSVYTVTVNTGNGNGTIRLDVVDNNSIVDATSNPLGGAAVGDGNFATGEVYTITKPAGGDTTGVFRPGNGLLYLKNANTTGFADVAINYGTGGDYPIAGDWDGNGTATIGIYRNGSFYLRNSNTLGFADIVFAFGTPGDQPVAGDWDGDGVDTIGVYSNGQFLLRNSNSAGIADMSFYLGNPGDVGIAGDWNGDGMDTTGVFRPSNGIFFLKNANTTGFADIALNYGLEGDMPVTGDWNNDGIDTIGVYRNAQFLLRDSNTIGFADIVFGLGNPGGMPISGNWDGLP